MGLFHSLYGMVHIELVSADLSGLLSAISGKNIYIDRIQSVDEMTVRANVLRSHFKEIKFLAQRRGDKVTVIEKRGIYWQGKRLTTRPVLLSGLMLLLSFALFLPSRIFFVEVKGNSAVPSKLIIEKADACGISIFANRRKVRSEKVKNALLEKIPELQWVGVNTAGCVATISVSEKTVADQPEENESRISSIVASRDGVVRQLTVLQGNQLCQVGQAVKAGQTLISGYTDCGIMIKATRAEGEIYAQTLHEIQVITPVITQKRAGHVTQKKKFSLLFGKKLIKLYKDSGISDASCVKIYDEFKLTLPGGFQLPVSLIRETITDYQYLEDIQTEAYEWLIDDAIRYLQSQMVAGQILKQDIQTDITDDVCYLNGRFSCVEMIGQVKEEEIIQR